MSKNKFSFIAMSQKTLIISILLFLLLFNKSNFNIMRDTMYLFLFNIVPALFPFIFFTNILLNTGYVIYISQSYVSKLLSKIFHTNLYGATAIIIGFLMGYPNSGKYINKMYLEKKISHSEATFLFSFTNNASPIYILSSIGIGVFCNIKIGIFLLICHILSSLIIGMISLIFFSNNIIQHNNYKRNNNIINNIENTVEFFPTISFQKVYISIKNSLETIGIIFAFMTIFTILFNYIEKSSSIILSVLNVNNLILSPYILGLFELTNGINILSNQNITLNLKIIIISFLLGFSSLSIIFQIFSCVYKNNISLKKLIIYKVLHGIISAILSYALLVISWVRNMIYQNIPTYSNTTSNTITILSNKMLISYCIFCLLYILVFFILLITKKKTTSIATNRFKGG